MGQHVQHLSIAKRSELQCNIEMGFLYYIEHNSCANFINVICSVSYRIHIHYDCKTKLQCFTKRYIVI